MSRKKGAITRAKPIAASEYSGQAPQASSLGTAKVQYEQEQDYYDSPEREGEIIDVDLSEYFKSMLPAYLKLSDKYIDLLTNQVNIISEITEEGFIHIGSVSTIIQLCEDYISAYRQARELFPSGSRKSKALDIFTSNLYECLFPGYGPYTSLVYPVVEDPVKQIKADCANVLRLLAKVDYDFDEVPKQDDERLGHLLNNVARYVNMKKIETKIAILEDTEIESEDDFDLVRSLISKSSNTDDERVQAILNEVNQTYQDNLQTYVKNCVKNIRDYLSVVPMNRSYIWDHPRMVPMYEKRISTLEDEFRMKKGIPMENGKHCRDCGHGYYRFHIEQFRSADEPAEAIRSCANCGSRV